MERKIGEIFEYNGEWHQVVECSKDNHPCIGCCGCKVVGGARIFGGECNGNARKDRKFVIFKKLEKVGEPVIINKKEVQLLKSLEKNECDKCCFNVNLRCAIPKHKHLSKTFYIELKNKEDMEEKKPMTEKLKEYLAQSSEEQLEKDLELLKRFNEAGVSVDEFIKSQERLSLKPFSLEAAKSGKPVCTRDGRKARIICFDKQEGFPIIALVETKVNDRISEEIALFNINGRAVSDDIDSKLDLMMSPEKKEGWVNIYRDADNNTPYTENDNIYSSRYKAKESAKMINMKTYIDTIKVEWEE